MTRKRYTPRNPEQDLGKHTAAALRRFDNQSGGRKSAETRRNIEAAAGASRRSARQTAGYYSARANAKRNARGY